MACHISGRPFETIDNGCGLLAWIEENQGAQQGPPGQPGRLVLPCGRGLIYEVENLEVALSRPGTRRAFPQARALVAACVRFDNICRRRADAALPAGPVFAAARLAADELQLPGGRRAPRGRRAVLTPMLTPTLHVLGHGLVTGYGLHWGSRLAERHEIKAKGQMDRPAGQRSWWPWSR